MHTTSTREAALPSARLAATKRTSVSLSERVYHDALAVATNVGHRSFSGYLEDLMRRDIAARKRA